MDSKCKEIFMGHVQGEEGGAAIPRAVVSTYDELVVNTYIGLERDKAKYDVDFFLDRQGVSGIQASSWNNGTYFDLAVDGALEIYARFTERSEDKHKSKVE